MNIITLRLKNPRTARKLSYQIKNQPKRKRRKNEVVATPFTSSRKEMIRIAAFEYELYNMEIRFTEEHGIGSCLPSKAVHWQYKRNGDTYTEKRRWLELLRRIWHQCTPEYKWNPNEMRNITDEGGTKGEIYRKVYEIMCQLEEMNAFMCSPEIGIITHRGIETWICELHVRRCNILDELGRVVLLRMQRWNRGLD
ncbi:unnamed protein product [Citrullus colocynthis]|uniref:Uncharacterized protein n=1 Tax=Citrullus colocynthis TaxID=252529 RepID=A0ABP0YNP7_9ROSI